MPKLFFGNQPVFAERELLSGRSDNHMVEDLDAEHLTGLDKSASK
jgi:hypothetical protein